MTSITENFNFFKNKIKNYNCHLVAVSKTKPVELIQEAYNIGQRFFGENKVQELVSKAETLPKDIQWHLIGHLQSNKVKYIAPFVSLIHSIDSFKLLQEVNKQAQINNRVIDCLIQIYIAQEDTKFGLDVNEAKELLNNKEFAELKNIKIVGLMGMATNTNNIDQIRTEFKSLKSFFDELKLKIKLSNVDLKEISMGMSSDYEIALEEGSTFIRVGSSLFGSR